MNWWSFWKVFSFAFRDDPIAARDNRKISGPGVSQHDAMPDLRAMADGTGAGGGTAVRLRDSNDFVDLSTVTNRMHRYKEYDRLRSMAEIEMALTVFADEACMAGNTPICMPAYENGTCTIEWLTKNNKGQKFLVYSFDKDKGDYTLAWGYDPRLVGEKETLRILLDDGSFAEFTYDHRIMMRDETWKPIGELKMGDKLMPFYRVPANQNLTTRKTGQFPRIFTLHKGWVTERQFVDEWKKGKDIPSYENLNKYCRMIASGLSVRKMREITGVAFDTMKTKLRRAGFSNSEMKWLGAKQDYRRVIGIIPGEKIPVYDISVEKHACLCTPWGVVHNCQKDENGRVLQIICKDEEVTEELEFLLFHRKMLNLDQKKVWNRVKNLFAMGDDFWELIIDPENPKGGVIDLQFLPPDSMYRIETTKGKVVEFQQSKEGPDYQSLSRVDVTQATEADLMQATAIRFAPEQIIHVKIGDERKTFYPYGISVIEAARGPAHQLRLMEDAMVVYRLCVTGYVRVRTKFGWKYIKDIQVGDEVFSCDDDGCLFPTKIIWTVNNGVKDVYRVRSQHVEITGTATHPILVERDGTIQYVDIQDLIPKKDKLINATRDEEIPVLIPRTFTEAWGRLSEEQRNLFKEQKRTNGTIIGLIRENGLRESRVRQFLYKSGKSLPYDEAKKVCDVFDLNFKYMIICEKHEIRPELINLPEYVDEDFARLFGFLIGYGSIRAKGVGAMNQLHFSSSPDEELNYKYASLLKRFFGKYRFEPDKRCKRGLGNYTVDSRFACRLLVAMGYQPGCRNKRIPSWVHTASKNIRRAFIEGISDADGCERYTKAGLWFSTIELCNKQLVEDIKEVWHSIGLCSGKVKTRQRKGGHEIEPGRKMKPTESHSVTITDRNLPTYEKVWSVEHVGQEEVFDVTVDNEYHNIVSNGIIIHQTRAPERRVFYIDVQQLTPAKAEAFIERMKDQFKKKKSPKNNSPEGASSVEERWHAPSADEDFWVPIRPNSNTRVETLPGACLALDTKIPLLDGRILTLQEIIGEYESGKQLWAYSCCPKTGKTAPGLISWAGVTRKNAEVVKVTLDNGESVICTPDHNFPVQNVGEKVQAKDLQPGYSLFPFSTRLEMLNPRWKSNYEQVYDSEMRDWVFTHRMVANAVRKTSFEQEMVFDKLFGNLEKKVIHHIDINHLNNMPTNLAWMNYLDHRRYHRSIQPITNKNISKALKSYHNNLSKDDKKNRDQGLKERSKKGSESLLRKLKDSNFNGNFRKKQIDGWVKAKQDRPELHAARGAKITKRNKEFWSDPQNKETVFVKQRIVCPDIIWDQFVSHLKSGGKVDPFLESLARNQVLINQLLEANSHLKREGIDLSKGLNKEHIEKIVKSKGYKTIAQVRVLQPGSTVASNETGEIVVMWPDSLWNAFLNAIKSGESAEEALDKINSQPQLMNDFAVANAHNFGKKFRFKGQLTMFYIKQMVRSKGYTDTRHLKREAANYNHKVVSVEYLSEKMDTGTLTIDQNHEVHDYHTFAISPCGIYVYNSNLGEIDDTIYFRNKLFISLNFPKNYFNNEDAQVSRVSLSAQDIKFARMIERSQSPIEDAFWELCDRHLRLRGFPEESYEDLQIKMTPPSDWRELTRQEITSSRIQNAGSLKGSQLMADFDILTKWMKYSEDEAKIMLARLKLQKLEELKFQIIAQNPTLSGVGLPPDGEQQIGTESSPDNPMPGGQPPPPDAAGPPPPDMNGGTPPPKSGGGKNSITAFPEPSDDDIHKYDMEINDFASEMDEEEPDISEES
jgi:intein/homing endonuclease